MAEIAIIGYGVVGSGSAEVWKMNREYIARRTGCEINIKKILDIRDFPDDELSDRFTRDPDEIFSDPEISVLIETIGGTGIAYEYTKRALLSGKSVVTSNKELVATHGPELLRIAAANRVSYLFEASVGGGIPIIRPLNKCLSGNRVKVISGILNGTTNYILSKMMREGSDFETALREAQQFGYAEQNPVSDVEGIDACRKLAILSSIATGEFIDYRDVYTEGISRVSIVDIKYASDLGYSVKLIAQIRELTEREPEAIVAPMFLPRESPLSTADDVFNAILVEGNALGPSMFYGKGAGKLPTASAVIADVIEAVLHTNLTPHKVVWNINKNISIRDHGECDVSAFIRLKDSAAADGIIDKINEICDVEYVGRKASGEKGYIIGVRRTLTEKQLRELVLNSEECLSMIRIYSRPDTKDTLI